jgi:hypothetical protein
MVFERVNNWFNLSKQYFFTYTDGISTLSFNQLSGNYYVSVKHRNHLGIMTLANVSLSDTAAIVDFTDANDQITFGTNAQTTFGMPTDILGMWAGDVNNDGRLNNLGANSETPSISSQVF